MNTTRGCGCKGYRSCLICEKELGIVNEEIGQRMLDNFPVKMDYCIDCDRAFPHVDGSQRPSLSSSSVVCPGICRDQGREVIRGIKVIRDFVTSDEESELMLSLDSLDWDTSQSGRRKQNFGPRANFKKRKAKVGQKFRGFPQGTEFVQRRFERVPLLAGYQTVEQCSIEYRPETGAGIDPHIDDCWIWGERIVQLNIQSDCVLTLFPYPGDKSKYNLSDVDGYPAVVSQRQEEKVAFNPLGPDFKVAEGEQPPPYEFSSNLQTDTCVRVPLPRRSLLVMYGEARYQWEHCVLRSDVTSRRVIIAYRELTPPYLPGGSEETTGAEIIHQAKQFW